MADILDSCAFAVECNTSAVPPRVALMLCYHIGLVPSMNAEHFLEGSLHHIGIAPSTNAGHFLVGCFQIHIGLVPLMNAGHCLVGSFHHIEHVPSMTADRFLADCSLSASGVLLNLHHKPGPPEAPGLHGCHYLVGIQCQQLAPDAQDVSCLGDLRFPPIVMRLNARPAHCLADCRPQALPQALHASPCNEHDCVDFPDSLGVVVLNLYCHPEALWPDA